MPKNCVCIIANVILYRITRAAMLNQCSSVLYWKIKQIIERIVLNKNLLCFPEPRSRSQQCLVAVSFTVQFSSIQIFFPPLWKYPLPVPLAEPVRGSCESQESDHSYVYRQKNVVLIAVKFPEEPGNLQRHEPTKLVCLLSLVLTSLPWRPVPVAEVPFLGTVKLQYCFLSGVFPFWSQTGSSVFSQSARRKM